MSIVYSKADVQRLDETGNERYIFNDPPFYNRRSKMRQRQRQRQHLFENYCETRRGQVGKASAAILYRSFIG